MAVALQSLGANIWYDEFALRVGDSPSKSIDRGLAESRYGIVVLSKAFIGKVWPHYELRGLIARDIASVRRSPSVTRERTELRTNADRG